MNTHKGISLVEILVGLTLGLILSIAVIGIYLAQKNTYQTNASQATIQNVENAISALVIPTARSAGFSGCTSIIKAQSNLITGGPPPLGSLNTTPSMIMGYDAAVGTVINIAQNNAANSTQANDWTSGLDGSLVGNVEATSDVVIFLGGVPGSQVSGIITIASGSSSFTVQDASNISIGQIGSISDCLKTSVFLVTSVSGTTIGHAAGTGALANTAFFVARNPGGQSALARATLNQDGSWSIQALAPGVDTMQVLYGIGSNGVPEQYVAASAVTNWGEVYSIRVGFLVSGQPGSGTNTPTQYTVLGSTVTVPSDNRLRHVYEMTINIRNSTS
jgi:type IV pilus assembly protein PilW